MKNGPRSPEFVINSDGDRVAKTYPVLPPLRATGRAGRSTPNHSRSRAINHGWTFRRPLNPMQRGWATAMNAFRKALGVR